MLVWSCHSHARILFGATRMNLPQRQVHSCHSRGLGWEFLQGYLCLHCWVELSLAALWEKYFISSTPRCISAATLTDLASQRYTEGQQCQQESLAQCLQLSFLFVLFVLYSFFSGVSAWQSSASETDHHLDNHRRHGHRCDTCKGLSQGGSCSQWWAGAVWRNLRPGPAGPALRLEQDAHMSRVQVHEEGFTQWLHRNCGGCLCYVCYVKARLWWILVNSCRTRGPETAPKAT